MSKITEIPNGWVWATIPEMIPSAGVFVDGDWIESKDQDPNGEVRLIQLADIGDGNFKNRSSRFLTLKRANALNCTLLRQNDILVARMPDPIGRACLFPLNNENAFVTAVDVAIIRLGETSVIPKYLMYSINNLYIRREIESLQSGTTRKRIARSNLAIINFPLPPLPEQHRIVAKIEELFSSLDKGIESLKTAQQELKVYRQAVLKWAFQGNWKVREFGTVAEIKRGKSKHRPRDAKELFGGPYPFIQTGEVRAANGGTIKTYTQTYSDIGLAQSKLWPKGTLCLTIAANIAETAFLGFDACFPDSVVAIKTDENNLSIKFVNFYIQKLKQEIDSKASATAQKNINVEYLEKIPIPLPQIEEQNAIVAEIESRLSVCEKVEENIEINMKQSDALRQSILKKAFEGKLVPQDPNDELPTVLLDRIKVEREKNKSEYPPHRQAGKTKTKKANS